MTYNCNPIDHGISAAWGPRHKSSDKSFSTNLIDRVKHVFSSAVEFLKNLEASIKSQLSIVTRFVSRSSHGTSSADNSKKQSILKQENSSGFGTFKVPSEDSPAAPKSPMSRKGLPLEAFDLPSEDISTCGISDASRPLPQSSDKSFSTNLINKVKNVFSSVISSLKALPASIKSQFSAITKAFPRAEDFPEGITYGII